MTVAVYPGTFDPITDGHVDIVKRASTLFDKLIIAIYDRPEKHLLFSLEERVEMARKVVAGLPNASVTSFTGLSVDFTHKVKGTVMIRGLRANSDFEREFEMALMNKKLAPLAAVPVKRNARIRPSARVKRSTLSTLISALSAWAGLNHLNVPRFAP